MTKRGISVYCTACGLEKAPRGRSLPVELYHYRCHADFYQATLKEEAELQECPGYRLDPKPGDLFPGETAEDFGYPCSDNATEPCEREAAKP